MLELKNIKKSYKTGTFIQHALTGVDLEFRTNEFVAVLGPSGSGKTTLLNIIGGLDKYDSGDLIINNKSTKKFKDSDWDAYRNNCIGFVFQSYNLINHISVLSNVEMGMTLRGISLSRRKKKAMEVLERVGLTEHAHKKPNQLSGGQMQRVAIARALANNPDIILADEPTGALDSKTSIQIMELIKEIAKDKLVIMVTHNAELSKAYANRIIELKDGGVIKDTNPVEKEKEKDDKFSFNKTSMSFLTALKLSFNNIITKKGRTILTAFASSIGIIGIALILSLSNGFDKQIDNFEANTLSGFPIMITQNSSQLTIEDMQAQRQEIIGETEDEDKYPDTNEVYIHDSSEDNLVHANVFTDEYIKYLEKINPSLLSGISYTRLSKMNLLKKVDNKISTLDTTSINFSPYPKKLSGSSQSYIEKNYDLLAGSFPTSKNDLILIVDSYNEIDKTIIEALGLDANKVSMKFNDILGKEFKVILNDDYYKPLGEYFTINNDLEAMYNSKNSITLTIKGIIRADEETALEVLSTGIAYSYELSEFYINNSKQSKIVIKQTSVNYNILTGQVFEEVDENSSITASSSALEAMNDISSVIGASNLSQKDSMLAFLGASSTPFMITLYPTDFESKDDVISYLNAWNKDKSDDDAIAYTDLAETFTSLSGGVMDAITLVLIAFSAISLIVSSIMIGIITYISVLERTKEIGILRALGARKKDITRVFNAETFIIGLCSGLIGIGVASLLTVPINIILKKLTDLSNIAQLNPLHALILIIVSIILTLIGGFIPAKIASKKDPVEALRTE
ncbi:MAG: ABC transporter ATP-binding protein/permease [Bacilli bacterium]|nr:ABC transporter ATP-binding protein/permease [Bacilli bacterium]